MHHRQTFILILFFLPVLFVSRPLSAQRRPNSTDSGRMKDLKSTIAQTREDFKLRLEEMKKEASKSVTLKKAELQQRLLSIRNLKKRALVTRINDKMVEVNKRRTQKMLDVLEKLTSILDRLTQKAEAAKVEAKDVTLVEQAITEARTSIDTAQVAVASQALKIYTIEASSEATLKTTVGKAVSQLHFDLKVVHQLVIAAKQKVAQVIREAARAGIGSLGKKEEAEASSPTPGPTL